ncbi:N-acetylglucosamine/diacetylchitobiose ABC transporter substrate-binding protein [Streptomyces jeddahensis]|uniref:Multiple sugar-binding protein n=1 Tax=Streptomyces jeddahensis TaxID=1716141 RepID=A0A177HG84_9ACTN|nr:N-acetylglucosamine/diacetylchitobiose ABC transporter substrate-binding protein [Streptomyces jeddahensis]OAH09982.1 multiple sugar-binding protein precursor [Streptomyces jeddahensis]
MSRSQISRRQLLRWAGTSTLAVSSAGVLGACATPGDSPTATAASKAATSKANPFGVANGGTLEAVIFKGGYGDAYATKVHQPLLHKAFPKLSIKHSSTPNIVEALQPRFVGGDVPDVSSLQKLDLGALIQSGALTDLTPLLDAPTVDDPDTKVRDVLAPGAIEAGTVDGKFYRLMYVQTVYGLWYDAQLFQKKGWQVPTTWDAFTELAGEIKKAGMDPFGVGGKNAADYASFAILAQAGKAGGLDVLKSIDNLEDGAWKQDAVIQTLTAWKEFARKYVDARYAGLMHAEAQLRQVQGKLAFYPSGSWLESEMKKDTPSGFTFAMMPVPSLTPSDALPGAAVRATAGEPFGVPAKAKNPGAGKEYLRQMVSKAGASGFTKQTGALTVVKDSYEGLTLTPGTKSAADALAAAGKDVFNVRLTEWYAPMKEELISATLALLFEDTTPAKFADRMEKKAAAIKADSSIKKFSR